VRDIVVLIDREQGGRAELAERGYALHSVLTLREILDALVDGGQVTAEKRDEVLTWIQSQS
jgi:uridine monophosphate synthetase